MVNVEWWMMGAKDGAIAMPNVGKIVVRGCTSFCYGDGIPPYNLDPVTNAVKDGEKPQYKGILGGTSFSLAEHLKMLSEKGECYLLIFNSFLSTTDVDTTLPPGPLRVCTVKVEMNKEKAASALKSFLSTQSHLFTESKLPNMLKDKRIQQVTQRLPHGLNTLFRQRILQGQYDLPINAPPNFTQLEPHQQELILSKEPGLWHCFVCFHDLKLIRMSQVRASAAEDSRPAQRSMRFRSYIAIPPSPPCAMGTSSSHAPTGVCWLKDSVLPWPSLLRGVTQCKRSRRTAVPPRRRSNWPASP